MAKVAEDKLLLQNLNQVWLWPEKPHEFGTTSAGLVSMLQLTEQQLPRPKGGRPRADKRQAVRWIFPILDNGAKWKDLPSESGTKSSVYRAFRHWVQMGDKFEALLADIGSKVEERDGFKLYECYVDGTFSKAKSDKTTKPDRILFPEEDIFKDLVDPVLFVGTPSRSSSAVDDAGPGARDLDVIPIRSMTTPDKIQKPTPPPSVSKFRDPWAINNILDLWRFFNIWITLLLALQIYASFQIMGIQNMKMKVESMWLAPVNFCLIALMSYLALVRRFGQLYQNFIPPLAIISIVSAILAIAPMIIMFFSR